MMVGLGLSGCTEEALRPVIDISTIHGKPSPEAAMFVSKQSPLMVSLMVRPEELAAIDASLIADGRSPLTDAQLLRPFLVNTGLDYNRDLKPWLGDEITLAVTTTDLDRTPENGNQPGYLLVISSSDRPRAEKFVDQVWRYRAMAGSDLVFEQYAGVTLTTAVQDSSTQDNSPQEDLTQPPVQDRTDRNAPTLATAIVDRFVLLANHPKVLRQALNTVQVANLSIANDARYAKLLTQGGDRLAVAVVNLPQWLDWVLPDRLADRPDIPQFTHLLAGLELRPDGLAIDASLFAAGEVPSRSPLLSAPVGALQFIPTTSALVAASSNLSDGWQQLQQGLAGYSLPWLEAGQTTLQMRWGVDVLTQILPQLSGEYAVALLPGPTPDAFQDWIVVIQTTDAITTWLQDLDAIATAQGLSIGRFPLRQMPVSAWAQLQLDDPSPAGPRLAATVQGSYATVGNYTILASSLTAMQAALTTSDRASSPDENRPLLGNDTFQRAIAAFTTPNDGYLYLDWPTLRGAIAQKIPVLNLVAPPDTPILHDLKSVTLSSYGTDHNARRGAALLRFRR